MLTFRRRLLSWHQFFRLSISCRPSHYYQDQADKTTVNKSDNGGRHQQEGCSNRVIECRLCYCTTSENWTIWFQCNLIDVAWLHCMQQKTFLEWDPVVQSSDDKYAPNWLQKIKMAGSSWCKRQTYTIVSQSSNMKRERSLIVQNYLKVAFITRWCDQVDAFSCIACPCSLSDDEWPSTIIFQIDYNLCRNTRWCGNLVIA